MNKIGLSKNGIVVPVKPQLVRSRNVSENPVIRDFDKLNRILSGQKLDISVVRSTGGIGDVLMTFPTVKGLKKKYNCNIHYITDFGYLDGALRKCAEHNPYIDRIIDFKDYNDAEYDIAINLTCPCIAHEKPGAKPIHRIDLFATYCGLELEDRSIDYELSIDEIQWGRAFLESRELDPNKVVMVQPYASNQIRSCDIRILKRALVQFVQETGFHCLIIQHGSDWERDASWDLKNFVPVRDYGIDSLAAIMHHVRLVLCQDSSILHLAGALQKDIVGLFGPTDYRARMYPNMTAVCPNSSSPHWPCILPGQLVNIGTSYKPIESITSGDKVLTHKGNMHSVLDAAGRDYQGDVYKFKLTNTTTLLEVTPEHPLYCLDNSEFKWILAKDVHVGMQIVMPNPVLPTAKADKVKLDRTCLANSTDDGETIVNNVVNPKYRIPVQKYVPLNSDTCWLFGMYIAEGSWSANKLRWTLGLHEEAKAKRLKEIIHKYFSAEQLVTIYNHQNNSLVVQVHNKLIGENFLRWFGSSAQEKRIPTELFNQEYGLLVLAGIEDGDGCKSTSTFSTVSQTLALQIRDLIQSSGHYVSFNMRKRNTNFKNDAVIYRIIKSSRRTQNFGMLSRVREVTLLKDQITKVYNMEVETDNSYTVGFAAVHNCWYGCPLILQAWDGLTPETIWHAMLDRLQYRSPTRFDMETL